MEDEMEMPCPCTHCGEWFDLHDGHGSDKWYPETVICARCGKEEEEEMERDDEIEALTEQLVEAQDTIRYCEAEFKRLGASIPAEVHQKRAAWTLISERLPEEAGTYIVTCKTDGDAEVHAMYLTTKGEWEHEGEPVYCLSYLLSPTHWMSLPAPAN